MVIEQLRQRGEQECIAMDESGLPHFDLSCNDRRERSLAALAERFVQLFVVGIDNDCSRTIPLHDAAIVLSSTSHASFMVLQLYSCKIVTENSKFCCSCAILHRGVI